MTGVRKFDHTSPVLRELHWLPVRHRITYKLSTIVYKCLHGLAPADDCVSVTTLVGRRHLRSADSICLVIPRTRTVLGTRNFAVAGPLVWNSLPANLRSASVSLRTFAGRLKTRTTSFVKFSHGKKIIENFIQNLNQNFVRSVYRPRHRITSM